MMLFLVLPALFWVFHQAIYGMVAAWIIEKETGASARVRSVSSWLWDGRFICRDVTVYQPEGFGPGVFLELPTLEADMDLLAWRDDRIHFRYLKINLDRANILRDSNNQTTLSAVRKFLQVRRGDTKVAFQGIDKLVLTLNQVHLATVETPDIGKTLTLSVVEESFQNVDGIGDLKGLWWRLALSHGVDLMGVGLDASGVGGMLNSLKFLNP